MPKRRAPFHPDLFAIAAKGGRHEMEKTTLNGLFHPKSGGTPTSYKLDPWVNGILKRLAPGPVTNEQLREEMLNEFDHLKDRSETAIEQHLSFPRSYLQTWGFLTRRKDGLFDINLTPDLSKFEKQMVESSVPQAQSAETSPKDPAEAIRKRLGEIRAKRAELDGEEKGLLAALSLIENA